MSEAYKQAGVDLHAGYEVVARIKQHAARTLRSEVMGGLGGFGGLFALPVERYHQPILVSGTDGVGTKLKLAFALNKHDTVGIDLVAMCANDVVAQGAEPLFFLDYFATGKVVPEVVAQVVKGIADGCLEAGCALIGGETAEMPDFYPPGEYDLAGFCVGIVEKDHLITGEHIQPGDVILGLPSSGLHSNGFSLARKVVDITEEFMQKPLGLWLLTPTRIYVKPVLSLMRTVKVQGIAHITGGGFIENIPRILPSGCDAEVHLGSWPIHPLFNVIQTQGAIPESEMYNVFNMGIGMVIVIREEEAAQSVSHLQALGEQVYRIGTIVPGSQQVVFKG